MNALWRRPPLLFDRRLPSALLLPFGSLLLIALILTGCAENSPDPPVPPPPPAPTTAELPSTPPAPAADLHPADPSSATPEPSLTPSTLATVTIDWSQTHQTLVGFGGTMSWIHPPPEKREEVIDLIFTRLGASVLRVQALGAETGDEGSLEPTNDNADPAVFNWEALPIQTTEAKNAVLIQAAQKRGVKTIVPTAWSPPGWMKTGNSRVGGALKEEMLDEYAECWTAYVLGMKKQFHLDLPYISIQNEPDLTYTYPTCGIGADLYARAAAKVAARFKREQLSTQVLGPDTCRIYHLDDYLAALDAAHVSPTRPALTHLYDLSLPFDRLDKDKERWEAARQVAAKYQRPLWQMECSNYLSPALEKGSFTEALIWAQHIHWALTAGDCEVVCFWSLFFDKKGEALIYCARTEDPAFEILPVFYTSLNFFRPLRPGMVRCSATVNTPELLVSAYRAPTAGPAATAPRKVIECINPGATPCSLRWAAQPESRWYALITTATRHNDLVKVESPGEFTLPPESVVTLIAAAPEVPASPTLDDLCPLSIEAPSRE